MSGDLDPRPAPAASVRLVCADADHLFTLGLKAVLTTTSRVSIVGETTRGDVALRMIERLKPDVLVIDLEIAGMPALEVLQRLAARRSATRALVVADDVGAHDLRMALVHGARGMVERNLSPALFVKCIRCIAAGEYWLGRRQVADLVEALKRAAPVAPSPPPLSKREKDIVDGVIAGGSNREIGEKLGLGEQTVKNHLRRAYGKLRVSNRVELAIKLSGDRGHE